jgi:hypothetical protein
MKTYFAVKNETGETWPAYGMARLGAVLQYDGVNSDVPLYTLVKPDGAAGIYIVNGVGPLATATEGTGIQYLDAQYVAVGADEDAGVGGTVGAIAGQWTAGSGDGNGSQFTTVDIKNDDDIAPVIAIASGGSGSTGSAVCPCNCLGIGDVVVNGIETTSRWSVKLTAQPFHQIYGDIRFPGGTHILTLDSASSTWVKDIGDLLTAEYADGTDATDATTMDGTLTLSLDIGGKPTLKLCVDGEVTEPPGGY